MTALAFDAPLWADDPVETGHTDLIGGLTAHWPGGPPNFWKMLAMLLCAANMFALTSADLSPERIYRAPRDGRTVHRVTGGRTNRDTGF